MRSRRVWIVVALALTGVGFAQDAAKGRVAVEVVDPSGAFVPDAIVQVVGMHNTPVIKIEADVRGRAAMSLDPGIYFLIVTARGFKSFSQTLDVTDRATLSVRAVLAVGNMCAGCLIISGPDVIEIEHDLPDGTIATTELKLAILPARKLRMRW